MSRITTHVLDTVLGGPGVGVAVRLEAKREDIWVLVGSGVTDTDGRCRDLIESATAGNYRLVFSTGPYFERNGRVSIYPEVAVTFVCDNESHYHLPLLLSDNSYTTYRGS